MKIRTQIEIPNEFLRTVTVRKLILRLSDYGFEQTENPEIWKHPQTGNCFRACIDSLETICEYSGISVLSMLQDFGWGKCRTCSFFDAEDGDCNFVEFPNSNNIIGVDNPDNFGCIHYKFKGV